VSEGDLFDDVEERGRLRGVVQPTRRALGRVLRPYFAHQQAQVDRVEQRVEQLGARQPDIDELLSAVRELAEIQAQLTQALEALTAQVGGLVDRQDEVDRKAAAVAAVTWDHVALTRRLASLEDSLSDQEAGRVGDREGDPTSA
jgi:ABC-type transporter Mla subunit MlaD